MTEANPDNRAEYRHSPNAERLRLAMGWDLLPGCCCRMCSVKADIGEAGGAARRFSRLPEPRASRGVAGHSQSLSISVSLTLAVPRIAAIVRFVLG